MPLLGVGAALFSKIEPVTKELVDYLNATTFPYSLLDFTEQVSV